MSIGLMLVTAAALCWFAAVGLLLIKVGLTEVRYRRLQYSWRGW